jgi:nitrogen regulatory protein P-II 1
MYVLFVVLNAVDYLDDILSGFVEVGVGGATILDSQGMGSNIVNSNNNNIPLFGALRMLLEDSHPYSKTIFTVLENEELVEKTVKVVRDVVGDISDTGVGFMFTVPIGKRYQMGQ